MLVTQSFTGWNDVLHSGTGVIYWIEWFVA